MIAINLSISLSNVDIFPLICHLYLGKAKLFIEIQNIEDKSPIIPSLTVFS